ncbi:MAG: hypothetical protein D6679_10510 [Candidatus Hydrogenedentota bacterium]|nr:MAG: hypothetical protein D6679_10510 [Candidatus Hydrogenedentota bacterium]
MKMGHAVNEPRILEREGNHGRQGKREKAKVKRKKAKGKKKMARVRATPEAEKIKDKGRV